MTTPEGKVKTLVKRMFSTLREQGHKVWHFMPTQNGMGAPGLDFFCSINGKFVAIETKVGTKKLTDRQKETARNIAQSGGTVYVIRNADDIERMIRSVVADTAYVVDALDPYHLWRA